MAPALLPVSLRRRFWTRLLAPLRRKSYLCDSICRRLPIKLRSRLRGVDDARRTLALVLATVDRVYPRRASREAPPSRRASRQADARLPLSFRGASARRRDVAACKFRFLLTASPPTRGMGERRVARGAGDEFTASQKGLLRETRHNSPPSLQANSTTPPPRLQRTWPSSLSYAWPSRALSSRSTGGPTHQITRHFT